MGRCAKNNKAGKGKRSRMCRLSKVHKRCVEAARAVSDFYNGKLPTQDVISKGADGQALTPDMVGEYSEAIAVFHDSPPKVASLPNYVLWPRIGARIPDPRVDCFFAVSLIRQYLVAIATLYGLIVHDWAIPPITFMIGDFPLYQPWQIKCHGSHLGNFESILQSVAGLRPRRCKRKCEGRACMGKRPFYHHDYKVAASFSQYSDTGYLVHRHPELSHNYFANLMCFMDDTQGKLTSTSCAHCVKPIGYAVELRSEAELNKLMRFISPHVY
jgi:hypothetical protein